VSFLSADYRVQKKYSDGARPYYSVQRKRWWSRKWRNVTVHFNKPDADRHVIKLRLGHE